VTTNKEKILIYNDRKKCIEEEVVFGDAFVRFLYQNPIGALVTPLIAGNHLISKAYGLLKASASSTRQIDPFCKKFGLNMDEFEKVTYENFNDFFIRRFKDGARPFNQDAKILPAPCEARYTFYSKSHKKLRLFVKGASLCPREVLGDEVSQAFEGGPVAVARLAPVDYHRFHFPDDGTVEKQYPIHGKLNSVNPLASFRMRNIFCENERRVSILDTRNFGKIAYVEVGALCVGRIVQTHTSKNFTRGDEKGYFLFGGSTVILFGTPGSWSWRKEFLSQNAEGREVLIQLGRPLSE